MPGPLPTGTARRRNAPTIPTTNLPASGFAGGAPDVPAPASLEVAGQAWWDWAWTTPQAAAWDAGSHQALARRAALEDDPAPTLGVLKEMRELDDRFGLTPKGMAALRWKIVADEAPATGAAPTPPAARRLVAVPAPAATG